MCVINGRHAAWLASTRTNVNQGRRLIGMNNAELARQPAVRTTPKAEVVANFVTNFGRFFVYRADMGNSTQDEDEWFQAYFKHHFTHRSIARNAGATAIQAAWRGSAARTEAQRRASRKHIHDELALLAPRHGFPGGDAYRAASARFGPASSSNGTRRNRTRGVKRSLA